MRQIFLVALLLVGQRAGGEEPTPLEEIDRADRDARRQEIEGLVMFGAGAATATGGLLLAFLVPAEPGELVGKGFWPGVAFSAIGGAVFLAGTIIWPYAAGQRKKLRARRATMSW